MRVHHFVVATAAATVAALAAASGFARSELSLNNPVRITDTSCDLGYVSVSDRNTRIVFGVFNLGSVAHGFDISGKYKTGLIQPGQEQTLVANFGRPGAYRYACVAAHSTVTKGVFTIRRT